MPQSRMADKVHKHHTRLRTKVSLKQEMRGIRKSN